MNGSTNDQNLHKKEALQILQSFLLTCVLCKHHVLMRLKIDTSNNCLFWTSISAPVEAR